MNLHERVEHIYSHLQIAVIRNDADIAAIESALRDVVEECAKVAENEVGSTRREIAAAIRRLKEGT